MLSSNNNDLFLFIFEYKLYIDSSLLVLLGKNMVFLYRISVATDKINPTKMFLYPHLSNHRHSEVHYN